jgi:hypothetical protein
MDNGQDLKGILSKEQWNLLYREFQNFADHVCLMEGLEAKIYHFLMTKTLWFWKSEESITATYFLRGSEGHCIRAFPRDQSCFYRARRKLEARSVITVTRTKSPNWIIVRLELPGILEQILSTPALKQEKRPKHNRRQLVLALDQLKKLWKKKGRPLKAVTLRDEIAGLLTDVFEKAPTEEIKRRDEIVRLGRKVKRICMAHNVPCSESLLPSGHFEQVTLSAYRRIFGKCRELELIFDAELTARIKDYPAFAASKPKDPNGKPLIVSKKLRLQDLFLLWGAIGFWIDNGKPLMGKYSNRIFEGLEEDDGTKPRYEVVIT